MGCDPNVGHLIRKSGRSETRLQWPTPGRSNLIAIIYLTGWPYLASRGAVGCVRLRPTVHCHSIKRVGRICLSLTSYVTPASSSSQHAHLHSFHPIPSPARQRRRPCNWRPDREPAWPFPWMFRTPSSISVSGAETITYLPVVRSNTFNLDSRWYGCIRKCCFQWL